MVELLFMFWRVPFRVRDQEQEYKRLIRGHEQLIVTSDVCWQLIKSERGKYENVLEIVLLFTGRTIDEVINYNPIKCPFAEVDLPFLI